MKRRWSLTGLDSVTPVFDPLTLPQIQQSNKSIAAAALSTGSPHQFIRQLHTEPLRTEPQIERARALPYSEDQQSTPQAITTSPAAPDSPKDSANRRGDNKASLAELNLIGGTVRRNPNDLPVLRKLLQSVVSQNTILPSEDLHKLVLAALKDRCQYLTGLRKICEWVRMHEKGSSWQLSRVLVVAVCNRVNYLCDSIDVLQLRSSSGFLSKYARIEIEEKLAALREDREDLVQEISHIIRSNFSTAELTLLEWSSLIHVSCRLARGKDAQSAVRIVMSRLSEGKLGKTSPIVKKKFWLLVMRSFALNGDVQGVKDARSMVFGFSQDDHQKSFDTVLSSRYIVEAYFNAGKTVEGLKALETYFDNEADHAQDDAASVNGLDMVKERLQIRCELLANVSRAFGRHQDIEKSLEWLEEVREYSNITSKVLKAYLPALTTIAKSQDWNDMIFQVTMDRLKEMIEKPTIVSEHANLVANLNFLLERSAQESLKLPSAERKKDVLLAFRQIARSVHKWNAWQIIYPSTIKAVLQILPQLAQDQEEPWTDIAVTYLAFYGRRLAHYKPSTWTLEQECTDDTLDFFERSQSLDMTFLQCCHLFGAFQERSDANLLRQMDLKLLRLYKEDQTPDLAPTLPNGTRHDFSHALVRLAESGYDKDELRSIFMDIHGPNYNFDRPLHIFHEEFNYRAKLVFGPKSSTTLSDESSSPPLTHESPNSSLPSPVAGQEAPPALFFSESLALKATPPKLASNAQISILCQQVLTGLVEGQHPGIGPLLGLVKKAGRTRNAHIITELQSWMYKIASLDHDPMSRRLAELQIDKMCAQAFAECGEMSKSRFLRDKILSMGDAVPGDIYGTWIAKMSGTTDEAGKALSIYHEAKSLPFVPTLFFYNTVISRLAKARQVDQAIVIFNQMQAENIRPSNITYGALVSGCCRIGDLTSADFMLQEMLRNASNNMKQSAPPFNSMMQAYQALGDRPSMQKYAHLMSKNGVAYNSQTIKLFIEMYATIAPVELDRAHSYLMKGLENTDFHTTSQHCIPFIRAHGILLNDLGGAIRAFYAIPSLLKKEVRAKSDNRSESSYEHDAESYEAIFEVFIHHKRYDLVEQYYLKMKEARIAMTPYVANALIKSRAARGDLASAREIFDNMLDEPLDATQHTARNDPKTGLPFRQPSSYEVMILAEHAAPQPDLGRIEQVLASLDSHGYPDPIPQRIKALAQTGEVQKREVVPEQRVDLSRYWPNPTSPINPFHAQPMSTSARTHREAQMQEPVNVSHNSTAPIGDQPQMADTPAPRPPPGSSSRSAADRGTKFKAKKAAMTLTPRALDRLRSLLESPTPQLIRVGVRNKGCAGMSYHLEYTDKPGKFDEVVEQDGVKVLIDSKALFSIIGSEMDYVEDRLSQGFRFWNPQVADECGCGSSFALRERPSMETEVDQPL